MYRSCFSGRIPSKAQSYFCRDNSVIGGDTRSKEEYASQSNALLFHVLFIKTQSICALVLFALV